MRGLLLAAAAGAVWALAMAGIWAWGVGWNSAAILGAFLLGVTAWGLRHPDRM